MYIRLLDDLDLLVRIMENIWDLNNQDLINLIPDQRERMDILRGFCELTQGLTQWLSSLGYKC